MAEAARRPEALEGIHVLVVDDHLDARDVLSDVVRYCGAMVTRATSAEDALDALQHVIPDVLLVDLSTSRHDGPWFIAEVRRRGPRGGVAVPAVAIIGSDGDAPPERRGAGSGFQARLTKPVAPWHLVQTLRRVTQGK